MTTEPLAPLSDERVRELTQLTRNGPEVVSMAQEVMRSRALLAQVAVTVERGYWSTRTFIDDNVPGWTKGDDSPVYWAMRVFAICKPKANEGAKR